MSALEAFSTARMQAERLRAEHEAEIYAMHQNPRVMATLTKHGGTLSAAETTQWMQHHLDHWAQHGFGLWVFRNHAGDFIGRGGLVHTLAVGTAAIELAYGLLDTAWKQGLATEMARVGVQIGFEQLRLPELVCFTLTTNLASQRVMQKAGFRYERDFVHVGLPHVLYRINASQWQPTSIACNLQQP